MTRFSLSSILERKERRGEESKGGKKSIYFVQRNNNPRKLKKLKHIFSSRIGVILRRVKMRLV